MDEQQKQLIDRINQAQNILVTVSSSPSVDQLSAALGLTLVLNKLGKHGTAVFSGEVPSTLEFLKPEETLEKTTDSLRDFIIALDKNKADKLRYKVEDDVVRIFITPYKTSISDKDLQFSQGDFNVDVVVCLGVTEQQDLDSAITAHGRILHDATVASVSTVGQGSLGSINWVQPTASSLSEMVVLLADGLDKKIMDGQIATALLTGIVASTERFSNDKTTPKTMSASAELMSAGANQQLIATQLESSAPAAEPASKVEEPQPETSEPTETAEQPEQSEKPAETEAEKPQELAPEQEPEEQESKSEPGTLEINHEGGEVEGSEAVDLTADEAKEEDAQPQIHVDEDGKFTRLDLEPLAAEKADDDESEPSISTVRGVGSDGTPIESGKDSDSRRRMDTPPQLNANLTANTEPESLDPPTEELSLPSPLSPPLLSHDESVLGSPRPAPADWQPPAAPPLVTPDETLSEIEAAVDSPHLGMVDGEESESDAGPTEAELTEAGIDSARSAVDAALKQGGLQSDPLQPIAALNAQPLGPELQNQLANPLPASPNPALNPVPNTGFSEPTPGNSPADQTLDMPLPTNAFAAASGSTEQFQNPQMFPGADPQSPPSAFPGAPQSGPASAGGQAPPPVPPPMLPPLQT